MGQKGTSLLWVDTYSPWQRGTNENTNGLIRQYLPKGTDLSLASQRQLSFIEGRLNSRPPEFDTTAPFSTQDIAF